MRWSGEKARRERAVRTLVKSTKFVGRAAETPARYLALALARLLPAGPSLSVSLGVASCFSHDGHRRLGIILIHLTLTFTQQRFFDPQI